MATLPMMHGGCSFAMVGSLISHLVCWVEYTNDVHVNLVVIPCKLVFHGKVLTCTSRCSQLI